MVLESGSRLSTYKIISLLGSGGMGQVYAAEDTKLSRKVALKVLPPEMASPERLMRFEREAKAVAALDHPNIVTIYSVEESDGVHFITMQLVKGKTLTELISKKALPLNKLFEIAIPLADAFGRVSDHFGESPYFGLVTIRTSDGQVERQEVVVNPHTDLEKAKGIRVSEWLVDLKTDLVLLRQSVHGKGPAYVFADAGVETRMTQADTLAQAISEQIS